MGKLGLVALSTLALAISSASTSASTINVDNYIGADNNGRGDVIGSNSNFQINSKTTELNGTVLSVSKRDTRFTGKAGTLYRGLTRNGNSTVWSHGLSLKNRFARGNVSKDAGWWVDDSIINFSLGLARTKWLNGSENRLHWGFTGQNIVIADVIPVSAVPIPAAVWLFGSGLIALVGVARRKQS